MATLSYARASAQRGPDVQRPHLFAVLSCTEPERGASRHALHEIDAVYIGRGATSAVVRENVDGCRALRLALPDTRASTKHCRIKREGTSEWFVEDLGSKNGTYLGDAPVSRAPLHDGAVLRVGETFFIFREGLLTASNAPADVQVSTGGAFATVHPALAHALDELVAAGRANIPLLLSSETGTGKEVLARAVHAMSHPGGPFVAVNCGALPGTLTESVLFGHRRGAFSGATSDSDGLLRAANGGTLLLDEIGDMPLALQPALLRVIETGEVLPVGATQPVHTDARFIAATNVDLEARVASGAFREDLYARLAGFVFRMPPLRERREDIGLLAGALLRRIGTERGGSAPTLSPDAATSLLLHAWPRNVRELEKCLARAAVLSSSGRIENAHLPHEARGGARPPAPAVRASSNEDADVRTRLVSLLAEHRGNLAAVATAMRTSRSQVHRWLRRFVIDADAYRG